MCFLSFNVFPPQNRWLKNAIFSAGLIVPQVGEKYVFVYYSSEKKKCFCVSTKITLFFKLNPDVVRNVIADVGPLPEWSATIVAANAVRTPVINQKRDSKKIKAEVTKWRGQPVKIFARIVS